MNIRDSIVLVKKLLLQNVIKTENISHVPVLTGGTGIGKTSICKHIARSIGAEFGCVELSQTKEGDILGLPIPIATKDSVPVMYFAHNPKIVEIKVLENSYYEKAKNNMSEFSGLLGIPEDVISIAVESIDAFREFMGTLSSDSLLSLITPRYLNADLLQFIKDVITNADKADDSTFNISESVINTLVMVFGNSVSKNLTKVDKRVIMDLLSQLSPARKYEILKIQDVIGGFFRPYVLLLDEINRADKAVIQETFNILLSRTISDYSLPFWVMLVGAKNPPTDDFAVMELDDLAQRDRIYDIPVTANIDDFTIYALENGIHDDVIDFLTTYPDYLTSSKSKSSDDHTDAIPSPRSYECVSELLKHFSSPKITSFFESDDYNYNDKTLLRHAISLKIGRVATAELIKFIETKNDAINIEQVFNRSRHTVSDDVIAKYNQYTTSRKIYFNDRLLRYLASVLNSYEPADQKIAVSKLQIFTSNMDATVSYNFFKRLNFITIKGTSRKLISNRMIAEIVINNTIYETIHKTDTRVAR